MTTLESENSIAVQDSLSGVIWRIDAWPDVQSVAVASWHETKQREDGDGWWMNPVEARRLGMAIIRAADLAERNSQE